LTSQTTLYLRGHFTQIESIHQPMNGDQGFVLLGVGIDSLADVDHSNPSEFQMLDDT